jgi:hypothetical protein
MFPLVHSKRGCKQSAGFGVAQIRTCFFLPSPCALLASNARSFWFTVFVSFTSCFFRLAWCSRALAYADRDKSRVTASECFLPRFFFGVFEPPSSFEADAEADASATSVSPSFSSSSFSSSSPSPSSTVSKWFTSPTVTELFAKSSFLTNRATGFPLRFSSCDE